MMLEHVKEFLHKYAGRVAGSAAGLTIAILFLTVGFWSTLLVIICVGVGFFIGMFRDSREEFTEFVERIFPKGFK